MPTKDLTRHAAPAKQRRRSDRPDSVPAAQILERLQQEREATR